MSIHRFNARRDANEPELVAHLEAHTDVADVRSLSALGLPDLLCQHINGNYFFIEVKTASGRLTKPQQVFFEKARKRKSLAFVCVTTGDCDHAIAATGARG